MFIVVLFYVWHYFSFLFFFFTFIYLFRGEGREHATACSQEQSAGVGSLLPLSGHQAIRLDAG